MRIRLNLTVACAVVASGLVPGSTRTTAAQQGVPGASDSLNASQIDHLVLLGKVWGFAKYHHPHITSGRVDWDAELRRILPSVRAARGRAEATTTIITWLERVGPIDPCRPCAAVPADAHLRPDIDWIRDERTLGRELSALLLRIHQNRRAVSAQHYVSFAPQIGNPVFSNETDPAGVMPLDGDIRLLALYRFWNIIEYWFPYRDLIEEDWDAVLGAFVPELWQANEASAYRRSMMALIARVHDTHANLWSSLDVRPPVGTHRLPVTVRFIEGRAVVTGLLNQAPGLGSGFRVGDVIERIDGQRVDSLTAAWARYYAASNQPTRLRDMGRSLTQGTPGAARVSGERDGKPFQLSVARMASDQVDQRAGRTHDLPGEAFQMLSEEVAYLKLSAVSAAQSADYIRKAAGARVLVIDIRNYPREFMVFELGQHLVAKETPFARFTTSVAANPGTFVWTPPVSLRPAQPHFAGSVVILVDESSQSQAEYTTMAFRSAPNVLVVGSTTAGADGNVSPIPLPGGLRSLISGIGVFYPDKRPTQRIGIVPDLVVRPTIAGIREGRDEVLEAAVTRALGRTFRLLRLRT